jgi:hypothetical protein
LGGGHLVALSDLLVGKDYQPQVEIFERASRRRVLLWRGRAREGVAIDYPRVGYGGRQVDRTADLGEWNLNLYWMGPERLTISEFLEYQVYQPWVIDLPRRPAAAVEVEEVKLSCPMAYDHVEAAAKLVAVRRRGLEFEYEVDFTVETKVAGLYRVRIPVRNEPWMMELPKGKSRHRLKSFLLFDLEEKVGAELRPVEVNLVVDRLAEQ